MDDEFIIFHEKPDLTQPYMIIGLAGWVNAGEVPSSVVVYLISRFQATLFAELKPDEFYCYQSVGSEGKRPVVNIENGIVKSVNIVSTNFWYHKSDVGGHDVILVSGPEPDHNWAIYTDVLIQLAQEFQVAKIISLGGIFDAIPHTAPPRLTGVVSQAGLIDEAKRYGLELISYQGPSSVHSLVMVNANRANIQMLSIFAHTPHYIQVTNFMATYNLMSKLNEMLGLNIDLEVARKDSEYLCAQIDNAIREKPELREYLKMLESEYRKGKPEIRESVNKNIIKEIEDLMKKQQG
jgi:proteasome assembly chaperone (PAC2) family protein